jgi:predicted membrane channel-forming protein YqfA (hemolysin III family)
MLAAAGWAFALAAFLALRRPTRERLRLIMLMLLVYLAPLAAAILLFHLDRFDWAAPITYAFFAIVALMVMGAAWQLLQPVGVVASPAVRPLTPGTRGWLWVVAMLAGGWGMALAATDNGFSSLIWVWPGDLLSSRLIAVMLFTLAAAALYSLAAPDTAQITLATWVVYGFGVALANGWNLLAGKPVKELYAAAFLLLGGISLFLLWRLARSSDRLPLTR